MTGWGCFQPGTGRFRDGGSVGAGWFGGVLPPRAGAGSDGRAALRAVGSVLTDVNFKRMTQFAGAVIRWSIEMSKHRPPPISWPSNSPGKASAVQKKGPGGQAPISPPRHSPYGGPAQVIQRFFNDPAMDVEMEDSGVIAQRLAQEPRHTVHGGVLRFRYAHTGTFSKSKYIILSPSKSIVTNGHGECRKHRVNVFMNDVYTEMYITYEIQYYKDPNKFPVVFLMHIETKGHGYNDLKGVGALLVFAMCKDIVDRHLSDIEVALPAADQRGFYAHMGFDTSVMGQAPGKAMTVFQKSRTSAISHWLPA